MNTENQNISQLCTNACLVHSKRRRRRRNYRYYREASILDLNAILRDTLSGMPQLHNYFFPPENETATTPLTANCMDDGHQDNAAIPENLDVEVPVNCPRRTPDEALVPIHGAFYFHIRSKINLGKKIFKKEQAKIILDEQCLHYSRACKVGLVNYSIQDDHFHMLIAVTTDSYGVAREKASKMIDCIKQQFTKRFKN